MAAPAAPNTSRFGTITSLHAVAMLLAAPAIAFLPNSTTHTLSPLNEESIPAQR